MKAIIGQIFKEEFPDRIRSIRQIQGLGSVNTVYEVNGENGEYVIRLNEEDKRLEYKKESWCISKVGELGILVPEVLRTGVWNGISFMIQRKIPGINGERCDASERVTIWQNLGEYASIYQTINRIEEEEFERESFHKNWQSRLMYNLEELCETDSLLRDNILTKREHHRAREVLRTLEGKEFEMGLVHGDLCPRNVIMNEKRMYLLDWGTAEVNIVPHNEIGILSMSNEATEEEFELFLTGLGISSKAYQTIEEEIRILNFLHQVDIYRWAEGRGLIKVNNYDLKVRRAFDEMTSKM